MKKDFYYLFFFLFIVYFVLSTIVRLVFNIFHNSDIDYVELILVGLGNSIIFIGLFGLFVYFEVKPKIRFLQSDETDIPKFGSKSQITFPVSNDNFSFDNIISIIGDKYSIDYKDIDKSIVKFHTGWSIRQWQIGCFVQLNQSLSTVTVHCFPFSGGFTAKTSLKTAEFCEKIKSEILL